MKQKISLDYGFLANYLFSISLGLWSLPGSSVLKSVQSGAVLSDLIDIRLERTFVFAIFIGLAILFFIMGLYFATLNKRAR